MPSVFTHAFVAVATGRAFGPHEVPKRFWFLSIACSALPDLDVISFGLGIPYEHFFGHRGFFHAPLFGMLIGILVVPLFFHMIPAFSKTWWHLVAYFSLLTASHGILDSFTNGGLGIALLSPFSNARYFAPWTPIEVSPISVYSFFGPSGGRVIWSEVFWVWLPTAVLAAAVCGIRSRLHRAGHAKLDSEARDHKAV